MRILLFLLWLRVGARFRTVEYFPENKAVRGRRHPGGAAIFGGEHVGNFMGIDFALADLHERANDAAAHLVEKSIAFDHEGEQMTALADVAARHRANSRFHFVTAIG